MANLSHTQSTDTVDVAKLSPAALTAGNTEEEEEEGATRGGGGKEDRGWRDKKMEGVWEGLGGDKEQVMR